MQALRSLFFISILVLLSAQVMAHLEAGEDRREGAYTIDFGYSPKAPVMGESTVMMFFLVNATTKEAVRPTSVWIRISSDKGVLFSGTMRPDPEQVSFSYVFPDEGRYDVTARFKGEDGTLAESDFGIDVQSPAASSKKGIAIGTSSVIFLGLAAGGLIYVNRKNAGKRHTRQ